MSNQNKTSNFTLVLTILVWGSLWGIFETTVGYFLHELSFGFGWVLWYPAAYFFMVTIYRKTSKASSVVWMSLLCASIKLLNLLTPVRVDKVINPALSIVLESLTMVLGIYVFDRYKTPTKPMGVLYQFGSLMLINTGWRLLFICYLFVAPQWIQEVSVIRNREAFLAFLVAQNLVTSLVILCVNSVSQEMVHLLNLKSHFPERLTNLPSRVVPVLQTSMVALVLFLNITLQLYLR